MRIIFIFGKKKLMSWNGNFYQNIKEMVKDQELPILEKIY